jgi:hypothetical protein
LKDVRQALLLEAVEPLDGEPYKEILQLERAAAALHYHTLQ